MKFIGNYDILAEGKFLFEILAQLRNFGVERMVTKGEWMRKWPNEPSYCVIRKVEPEMDRWLSRGKVWAEWIFRGKALGIYQFSKELNRCDWHLIHKHEEHLFYDCKKSLEVKLPSHVSIPPLEYYLLQKSFDAKEIDKMPPPRVPLVPHVDEEFSMYSFTLDENRNEITDADKEAYLDLYGKELPCKLEKWKAGSI
ncbi:28S ribosomal protein S34, mitochondrial [Trichinella pseudospiralis]|uniref:28S ribosomal protein S34, mitochondrial n=1 Tax=Trichinella pseudospiralis TaxID=6337 RepID=A0A0V1FCD1_TRIPS|nr:28S ribosomal protein S34, mitochondrial [Trichinella pseudospiralis]KRY83624.1 28S ribosomal protein S34, mitochondrial [Trichinella pseudospiralis]